MKNNDMTNIQINKDFFSVIEPILIKLKNKLGRKFIIFGSAPLYLLGVVEFNGNKGINDLDVVVEDASVIPKEAKQVTFQKDANQKLYKLRIDNINIDIGYCWPGQEKFFYKLFKNPIIVNGFSFANLEIMEKWKILMVRKYNREKDKNYLVAIASYKKLH